MESETPIGFLQGAGGVSEQIKSIMELARPLPRDSHVVFSHDPVELIKELEKHLDHERHQYYAERNHRFTKRKA